MVPASSNAQAPSEEVVDPPTATPPDDKAAAELFTFESDHRVFAMNWSVRSDKPFRLALASFREETNNYISIIQLDEELGKLVAPPHLTYSHDYPPTKLMFLPDASSSKPDLMATTGEFLRIWAVHDDGVQLERLLSNGQSSPYSAPLTSFDWSEVDTRRLGVSSLDTTCTIWDIEAGQIDTQLIAHDKEVYDIVWGGASVFGTVSADGSVRVFDLRDKEHSTIIYEHPENIPLLRLAWNKQDPRYLATLALDSPKTTILDIRYPTVPCVELWRHSKAVNVLAWAPYSSAHICTAGDDAQVLIWELSKTQDAPTPESEGVDLDPILAYDAGHEITQLQWSTSQPEWLGICFGNSTQILRV